MDTFLIGHTLISDHYCSEANVTTPEDAPIRDWSGFTSWPRLSNQSSVREPSSDPRNWTPITLRTWIGSRWPRHTQQTKAEYPSLWNALCNSCDGQRHPQPPLAPAPRLVWHVLYAGEVAQAAASQRHSKQELVGDTYAQFLNNAVFMWMFLIRPLEEWEAYARLWKWDCFCTLLALSPPLSPQRKG